MGAFSNIFVQDASNLKLFPNYETVAQLALRQERNLSDQVATDVRQALFSEFEDFFKAEWEQLVGANLESTQFVRFGFASSSNLSQALEESNKRALECAFLSSNEAAANFSVVAPASTFQLVLDSWLGFDVVKLCQENDASRGRMFSEHTTRLEREILDTQTSRLGRLCPHVPVFNDWKARRLEDLSEKISTQLDELGYYWEQRSFEISGSRFSWFIVFPIKVLFNRQEIGYYSSSLEVNGEDKSFSVKVESNAHAHSSTSPRSGAQTTKANEVQERRLSNAGSKKIIDGTLRETDEQGKRTVEVTVEIGSDETSVERWNELRPGSILTTGLPANKLFVALFNGRPAYYVKPGLYRNASAVQIKSKIDV